ncbi:MAG: ComEC/Rec2 family competence protein [Bacillus sp. (in: firmicutes)]
MKNRIWLFISLLFLLIGLIGCSDLETSDAGSSQTVNEANEQAADRNDEDTRANHQSQADKEQEPVTVAPTDSSKSSVSTKVEGELKVYYFDVGQGDSILIQTNSGKNILIDGGNNNKGEQLVRYLRSLDVATIDAMIATHPDADHIGGLDVVLANLDVKSVYAPKVEHTTITYEDFILAVQNEGLKLKQAKAGVSLNIDGVKATFAGPVRDYGSDLNTWSAVLKVTFGDNSFLFTGDATLEAETDMINSGQDLSADVLKLGHHGAETSTSESFLREVNPKYAVVSAGQDNQYGHPAREVMDRLLADNINIYRTDDWGTILAVSDGQEVTFSSVEGLSDQSAVKKMQQSSPQTEPKESQVNEAVSDGTLTASVNNATPTQNSQITLQVDGPIGAPFTATLHYKSKDTVYEGTVGKPLPIRIGRAASGTTVDIDVSAVVDGQTYTTSTSFTPQ